MSLTRSIALSSRVRSTPDEWIPRHPDLVRLTGRHPFNVEPPLPKLMEHGFITPAALHYVRNHGAVPRIQWEEHRVTVGGLVDRPSTFTMDDLLAMPARELPITLVCAGNRRKEENLVAQTIGFNWGAAGVSTSVWKGTCRCATSSSAAGSRSRATARTTSASSASRSCQRDGTAPRSTTGRRWTPRAT